MNRILIVDDEPSITAMVRLCLQKNGYLCETANDGVTAARLIEEQHYDLALLDIMLPDIDGFDLLGYIRQYEVPVIFVTAKIAVADRVKGLRLGAEDYIVKPFDLDELLARVETVLRRYHKTEEHLTAGEMRLDIRSRTVVRRGEVVTLPKKEYDLLVYLVRNPYVALYRESIFEQVWQEPYMGNTRTVDLHMARLKKRLALADAVEAVYKIGYRFYPERVL